MAWIPLRLPSYQRGLFNTLQIIMTKAINNPSFAGSQSSEPRTIGDIIEKMLQSNSPMSRGYRTWQRAQFPTTEPCVDLKLITILPGGLPEGEYLSGVITRDGDDHFSFIENAMEKKVARAEQRNPHVYEGAYININRKPDGSLYPTFNRPKLQTPDDFKHFCLNAAKELETVAMERGEW